MPGRGGEACRKDRLKENGSDIFSFSLSSMTKRERVYPEQLEVAERPSALLQAFPHSSAIVRKANAHAKDLEGVNTQTCAHHLIYKPIFGLKKAM
jgi:hypothetical protein